MEGRGSQEQHERNELAKLTQMKSKVNRLRRSPKAAAPLNPGQIRNTGNKSPQNRHKRASGFSVVSASVMTSLKAPTYCLNVVLLLCKVLSSVNTMCLHLRKLRAF